MIMKIEDQDLLLKDLCGRLPYGVKCIVKSDGCVGVISSIESQYRVVTFDDGRQEEICDIKPYLFPLSSMTEEQKKEFDQLLELELKAINDEIDHIQATIFEVDFYNKHHLDWRGLIPKGLAIDATGLNIY